MDGALLNSDTSPTKMMVDVVLYFELVLAFPSFFICLLTTLMTGASGIGLPSRTPGTTTVTVTHEGMKEMLYLTTHSTHFIYSYMASGIW